MKKILIMLVTLFGIQYAYAQSKASFSGSYEIDSERTKFGRMPQNTLSKSYMFKQTTEMMIRSSIKLNHNMEPIPVVTDSLVLNGKANVKVNSDGRKTVYTAKWLSDNSFQTMQEYDAPDGSKVKFSSIWTLENNGNLLKQEWQTEQAGKIYKLIGYYNKQ